MYSLYVNGVEFQNVVNFRENLITQDANIGKPHRLASFDISYVKDGADVFTLVESFLKDANFELIIKDQDGQVIWEGKDYTEINNIHLTNTIDENGLGYNFTFRAI